MDQEQFRKAPAIMRRRDCVVVANPAAGRMRREKGRRRIAAIARDLDAPVLGLDSVSAEDFRACVAEASRTSDVVLVAGGDGTFTDALNAPRGNAALGYLPFGTGNALGSALGLSNRADYLQRVRRKAGTEVGVMLVNGGRKAFFASLGVDALTVRKYEELRVWRQKGLVRYGLAFAAALAEYRPADVEIRDGSVVKAAPGSLATIISKHPFYGYGLRVNRGDLTDPCLHVRAFNLGRLRTASALAAAALKVRPDTGVFHKGRSFTVSCPTEQAFQCDGEWCGTGTEFSFEVLARDLRIIL
ncbi:diacylglycerol/lipid kinase family protein [Desulfocurvus sp. DL9XJH121]